MTDVETMDRLKIKTGLTNDLFCGSVLVKVLNGEKHWDMCEYELRLFLYYVSIMITCIYKQRSTKAIDDSNF